MGNRIRAASTNFWQARPPQWPSHHRRTAAVFYSAKSRQGLGLGGLASRGGPENNINEKSRRNENVITIIQLPNLQKKLRQKGYNLEVHDNIMHH